jgi:hypothetical protein
MIVSVLLLSIIVLGMYIASHRLSGAQLLGVFLFLTVGIALVVFPNLASLGATALNVGRGSDLVIYFSIIGGLFVAANFYFRFKRQEKQLVAVVRQLALLEVRAADRP